MGTFGSATGLSSLAQCTPCSAGYYCNSTGIIAPALQCWVGYFCVNGTVLPSQLCPTGAMCPLGSGRPVLCPLGSYQDASGQSMCKSCPPGFMCQSTGLTNATNCPLGSYCLANTKLPSDWPCPPGTLGLAPNLQSASQCSPCPAGYYCPFAGQVTPYAMCSAGYLCLSGSVSATPTDGVTGRSCPLGQYCPSGMFYVLVSVKTTKIPAQQLYLSLLRDCTLLVLFLV